MAYGLIQDLKFKIKIIRHKAGIQNSIKGKK